MPHDDARCPRAPLLPRRVVLEGGLKIAAAMAVAPGAQAAAETAAIVATASGRLRGAAAGGVVAFKGIPYAGPTAGAGRFRPPTPAPRWTGVRDALAYGPPCIQNNDDIGVWKDPLPGSEDCLVLNVWTPALDAAKRPVMVWIHGGGFESGSGGLDIYDGGNLATAGDVVIVTINHRLNIFGYMYLGGVSPHFADSANLGQLDIVASLEWVRANIRGFGGDPGNVTVFGESGGGAKISALMAMPAAQGLFHKAIIESGSMLHTATTDEATAAADQVLAELGVDRARADALRSVPADRLLAAYVAVQKKAETVDLGRFRFAPVVDGTSLPTQPWDPGAPSISAGVPLLVGTNSDETVYMLGLAGSLPDPQEDDELKAAIGKFSHGDAALIDRLLSAYRKATPGATRQQLLVAITTDQWMWKNAVLQAERKAAQGKAPVFMYEFGWKTPCFGGMWALHGIEIPFVFGNLDYKIAWDSRDMPEVRAAADPKGDRFGLRDATIAAWASFARTGNPSTTALPWPAYTPDRRATMVLDATSRVVDDPRSEIRALVTG